MCNRLEFSAGTTTAKLATSIFIFVGLGLVFRLGVIFFRFVFFLGFLSFFGLVGFFGFFGFSFLFTRQLRRLGLCSCLSTLATTAQCHN